MKQVRRAALTAATVSTMNAHGRSGFLTRVAAVPRMIRDTMTGEYSGLGKGNVFAMVMAVAYLVSPIDLIPEALLTIPGLIDDTAIAIWLLAAATSAADRYLMETSAVPVYATATVITDPPALTR